jgi:H+-transporting ATPase
VGKRTEATIKSADGKTFYVAKGAPQVIMKMSTNAVQVKDQVDKAVDQFAQRGFRSLGVTRADEEGQWKIVGVLPLYDPPREQAKATIASAREMGVEVKMVTGDQVAIARETSRQLGMGTNILDASGLGDTKHHESAQSAEAIEKADGFAQVFPEHKYHIVDVLQQRGHIVGMTGDGVNDAPALKKADCGIAVSGATDAARAAASIVLLAPGLSVLIDAIKESRRIFQRMNSYAIYRIAETLRVLLFMSLAILVFNFYPVTAVMIVMLALMNDGAIIAIAFDNVRYRNKPEAWNMRVVLGIATILGVVGVVAVFLLFFLAERVFHLDHARVQTLIYLKLSIAGHLTIFLTRTRGPFWSIRPAKVLWIAVLGTQILATLIAVYGVLMTPLGWGWAGLVWGYAIAWALLNDRIKLAAYWVLDRADARKEAKHKGESKSDAHGEAQPHAKADVKPAAAPEAKPDAKAAAAPQAKPDAKPAAAPEAKPGATADAKPATAPQAKPDAKPAAAPEAKPDGKADAKPDAAPEAKPDAKAEGEAGATPELVARVHEMYEELGRQDVRAVQESDKKAKAARENRGEGRR